MATFILWSIDLTQRLDLPKDKVDNLLAQVKRAEKNIFAHNEVLDFDQELKKRNTNVAIVLDFPLQPGTPAAVVAYLIYVRVQKTVLLHKLCTLASYRRRGIAKAFIKMFLNRWNDQGCQKVQLWVDEANRPAKSLYSSVGFVEMDRVEGYYAPGRNGIMMVF